MFAYGNTYSIHLYAIVFLVTYRFFFLHPPVSSTNKTNCHNITELLFFLLMIFWFKRCVLHVYTTYYIFISIFESGKMCPSGVTCLPVDLASVCLHIGCVIVSMLISSALDCGFKPQSGKTKDNKFGICCISTEHAVLRRYNKDWLAQHLYRACSIK